MCNIYNPMQVHSSSSIRINISIPKHLVSELESYVPSGRKSGFIAQAVEKELAVLKRSQALKDFDDLPPSFTNVEDSTTYVRNLRAENEKRLKRLGL